MKEIHDLQYKPGSKEEFLPDFEQSFPYIASHYTGHYIPWHWHKEVELFYIEHGELEYYTPTGKTIFPSGSGGFVNSNVLHMTKSVGEIRHLSQLEHIFDAALIGGPQGSLIEQKYIVPLITSPQIEIIGFYPENPRQKELLDILFQSFLISKNEYAYEIRLRAALSEIWCRLLELSKPLLTKKGDSGKTNAKIKLMLAYIHEHYADKLTISEIADAAFISERECFRVFRDKLHISPSEYLKDFRLQKACLLLTETAEQITSIGHSCGLGSSSYFGKTFHNSFGCTPMEYRSKMAE